MSSVPGSKSRSKVRVDIANRQSSLRVPRGWIEKAIHQVLRLRKVKAISLSVVVVDDQEMHALNREFLEHDYPTDVLAFPMGGEDPLGEVIVSSDTAIREADERGVAPTWELLLYVIHGTLHLTGLRDKTEKDRAHMREAEQSVFASLNINASLWDDENV